MLFNPLTYTTITEPAEGSYREKGSKFLAFAYPVADEEEIRAKIESVKKRYFDARHHCFAWMLGPERKKFRAFDDGEPNHSAGDPILGQIRSRNLTNVLIVVVRYFGGVKLGVGGLISAYKLAAEDALSKATNIEVEVQFRLSLDFPYSSTSEVMRLIKEFDMRILKQEFSGACALIVDSPARSKERAIEKMELLKATGTDLRFEIIQ
jgi:uncharacterized YigZ family protein